MSDKKSETFYSSNELSSTYHDYQMFLAWLEYQSTYFFHCEEYAVSLLKSSPK